MMLNPLIRPAISCGVCIGKNSLFFSGDSLVQRGRRGFCAPSVCPVFFAKVRVAIPCRRMPETCQRETSLIRVIRYVPCKLTKLKKHLYTLAAARSLRKSSLLNLLRGVLGVYVGSTPRSVWPVPYQD